jgi:hypothetical protein
MQAEMVAYRAKDKIASLRVVDQGSEEQLLFFMEVAQRTTEIEVNEVVGEVPALGLIVELDNVVEPPGLCQRMMVVVVSGIKVSCRGDISHLL